MCLKPLKAIFPDEAGIPPVVFNNKTQYAWFNKGKWYKSYAPYSGQKLPNLVTNFVELPCRNCSECVKISRYEWTNRIVCEAQEHDKMCFLTLTYNNSHLHHSEFVNDDTGEYFSHPTLFYRDFQLFMKRVRKMFGSHIRFVVCGEYGTLTYRPHYHAILFGLDKSDFVPFAPWTSSNSNMPIFTSSVLDDLWSNGIVTIQDFESATARYVAGYVDKKLTKDGSMTSKEFYNKTGIVPPFIKSSKGLGRKFFEDNIERIVDDGFIFVSDGSGAQRVSPTEYWQRKYFKGISKGNNIRDYSSVVIDEPTATYRDVYSLNEMLNNDVLHERQCICQELGISLEQFNDWRDQNAQNERKSKYRDF